MTTAVLSQAEFSFTKNTIKDSSLSMKKSFVQGSNKSLNKYNSEETDDDDYDDDDSDYSDDFSEDEAPKQADSVPHKVKTPRMKGGEGATGAGGGSRRSRAPPQANNPTRPTHPMTRLKAAQASHKTSLAAAKGPDATEKAAIQRLLSARRLKMNDLKNENEEMIVQLRELREENRILKRTQVKQEKALEKFEDKESELPRLVTQHSKEVNSLKDQIKKLRDQLDRSERRTAYLETESNEKNSQLKKLTSLSADKQLLDRDVYRRRLEDVEKRLAESQEKTNSLQRYAENLQKNLNRQVNVERAKHLETSKNLVRVTTELDALKIQCKEQERILDITNIYSNRKPANRLAAGASSTSLASRAASRAASRQKQVEQRRRVKSERSPLRRREEGEEKKDDEERKRREEEEMEKSREDEERREREEKERKEQEDKKEREEEALLKKFEEEKEKKMSFELEMRERAERERQEEEKKRKEEEEEKRRKEEEAHRRQAEEEAKKRAEEEDEEKRKASMTDEAMEEKRRQLLRKMRDIDDGNTTYERVLREKPEIPSSILSMDLEKKKKSETERSQPVAGLTFGPSAFDGPFSGGPFAEDRGSRGRDEVVNGGRGSDEGEEFGNGGLFGPAKPFRTTEASKTERGSPNSVSRKKNLLNDLFGDGGGYAPSFGGFEDAPSTNKINAGSDFGTPGRHQSGPATPPKASFPWETETSFPTSQGRQEYGRQAATTTTTTTGGGDKKRSLFPWDDDAPTNSGSPAAPNFLTANVTFEDAEEVFGRRNRGFGAARDFEDAFGRPEIVKPQPAMNKFKSQGNVGLFFDQDEELEEFTL